MTHIFLIIVVSSISMNMQVEPMESMEQCQAAIKAIDIASKESSWYESMPGIDQIKCIEVKP